MRPGCFPLSNLWTGLDQGRDLKAVGGRTCADRIGLLTEES
jgi:hypothetical protein